MKISVKRDSFYKAKPEIFKRAKELRKNLTEAEKSLWTKLKGNQINGLRFKRQHPIGKFIVDFYCHKASLVIELDGSIHNELEVAERDKGREYELERLGLKVVRFTNKEVLENIEKVVENIISTANMRK